MGWAITPAQAHCKKNHTGEHPHCNGDPPPDDGGDDGEYSVLISFFDPHPEDHSGGDADVGYHSGTEPWIEGTGGKSINIEQAPPNHPQLDVGFFDDLSFFTVPAETDGGNGGPFSGDRGMKCFGSNPFEIPLNPGGHIKKGRGGRAEGHFWFPGFTWDKLEGEQVPVLYLLSVFGQFDPGDWLPASGNTTRMTMIDWELRVENEGDTVKNISCIGEGGFTEFHSGDRSELYIYVERTN